MATDQNLVPLRTMHSVPVVFGAGAAISVLGGMIGLGGAEFRLPLLISLLGFAALSAVILNKAMSLVVVLVALPARLAAVPFAVLGANLRFTLVMAAGSVAGAVLGGLLLGVFPDLVLIPLLAVILLVSAVKLARHD